MEFRVRLSDSGRLDGPWLVRAVAETWAEDELMAAERDLGLIAHDTQSGGCPDKLGTDDSGQSNALARPA